MNTNADPEHAPTPPADAPCHICGKPRSQPGELYCSALHAEPADAPSKDYVCIGFDMPVQTDAPETPWVVAARRIDDQSRVPWVEEEDIIRAACEQHAAALAQERDALRAELEQVNHQYRSLQSFCDRRTDCLTALTNDIARLTAERDRLAKALRFLGTPTQRDSGTDLCWCSTSAHVCLDQPGCTVARAALAPTQKEEA